MGDNSDKKKKRVTYFFMKYPFMKFQNISIHTSNAMLCYAQESNNIKWPKNCKGTQLQQNFIKLVENFIR